MSRSGGQRQLRAGAGQVNGSLRHESRSIITIIERSDKNGRCPIYRQGNQTSAGVDDQER
jgi:hypothetical protein